MKKYLRIISTLLALLLTLSIGVISASAVRSPATYGDVVDNDGVNIMDATYIQRFVAGFVVLSDYETLCADVDLDYDVTIIDATIIQQKLAEMIDEFPAGEYTFIDLYAEALVSDYSSGKAMVGTPVTFTAIASGYCEPFMYEFYINNEIVQEYSKSNTYTHTFLEAGTYSIVYNVTNRAGIEISEELTLTVIDAENPSGIYLSSIYHKGFYDSYVTFEAIAKNGVAPYEYEFILYEKDGSLYGDKIEEQSFSEQNTFTLHSELTDYSEYILQVTVKDADGNTDTDTLSFTYMTPPPA